MVRRWVRREHGFAAEPRRRREHRSQFARRHLAYAAITQDPGVSLPDGIVFPFGFLELAVIVPSGGTATTVTISGLDTSVITDYYKYGVTPDDPADPHWYSFLNDAQTPPTGMEIVDGNLVLQFVDGGRGDDDLQQNAVIFDIGGPVSAGQVDSPPTATNLSAAETYTEDTPLNLIDIVVSEVDSPAVTATLTLSNPAAGSLNAASSGAVTSTYVAGTGVWTRQRGDRRRERLAGGIDLYTRAELQRQLYDRHQRQRRRGPGHHRQQGHDRRGGQRSPHGHEPQRRRDVHRGHAAEPRGHRGQRRGQPSSDSYLDVVQSGGRQLERGQLRGSDLDLRIRHGCVDAPAGRSPT